MRCALVLRRALCNAAASFVVAFTLVVCAHVPGALLTIPLANDHPCSFAPDAMCTRMLVLRPTAEEHYSYLLRAEDEIKWWERWQYVNNTPADGSCDPPNCVHFTKEPRWRLSSLEWGLISSVVLGQFLFGETTPRRGPYKDVRLHRQILRGCNHCRANHWNTYGCATCRVGPYCPTCFRVIGVKTCRCIDTDTRDILNNGPYVAAGVLVAMAALHLCFYRRQFPFELLLLATSILALRWTTAVIPLNMAFLTIITMVILLGIM